MGARERIRSIITYDVDLEFANRDDADQVVAEILAAVQEPDDSIESDAYCGIEKVAGGAVMVTIDFVTGDPCESTQYVSPREARVLARRLLLAADHADAVGPEDV